MSAKLVDRAHDLGGGQGHFALGHRELGDAVLVHEVHRIADRLSCGCT